MHFRHGDVEQTMRGLAQHRPVFHSEADFPAWFRLATSHHQSGARIRLETRPRPGVRLDVLAVIGGRRVAFELKYLVRDLTVTIDDELFELPNHSAQEVRRYDFLKEVA